MIPYWFIFTYLSIGALLSPRAEGPEPDRRPLGLLIGMILIALIIGLRYNVGTDWFAYARMFKLAYLLPLFEQFKLGDPGYQSLNWIVARLGGPFWLVNLICGSVFAYGLWMLARQQSEPWLAATVAFPYLTVVVAMGYARQGVAIGILMAGLAAVSRDRSFVKFVAYVGAATAFHSSALLVLPLALFGAGRSRVLNFFLIVLLGAVFYTLFLSSNVDHFVGQYVKVKYDSQGATIRVIMCAIPAAVFFLGSKRMGFTEFERGMWRNFSIAAFGLLVALFLAPSSTAIDRMALYVLPLQIAVLARLPQLMQAMILPRLFVIGYMAAVLFVWLSLATHAQDWIPYRSYLWR